MLASDGNDAKELQTLWKTIWQERLWPAGGSGSPGEKLKSLEQCETCWTEFRPLHLPLTLQVALEEAPREFTYGQIEPGTPNETALLLLAGYSPEQLALCAAAHVLRGCARVFPVTSKQVWNEIREGFQACLLACLEPHGDEEAVRKYGAAHLTRDRSTTDELLEVQTSDPADVFQKITAWVHEHPSWKIAIDCTGGQAPMDAGALHAASFYGIPAYYLGFRNYDLALRRPVPSTLRYGPLSVPESAFSLRSRLEVFQAFNDRRFEAAKGMVQGLTKGSEGARLLGADDKANLAEASNLILRSAAWMSCAYNHPSLEHSHPLLHKRWIDASQQLSQNPRSFMKSLLESPDLLWEYAVDEYWRIWAMHETSQHRDATIGCAGLAELLVDGMLHLPWFASVPGNRKRLEEIPKGEFPLGKRVAEVKKTLAGDPSRGTASASTAVEDLWRTHWEGYPNWRTCPWQGYRHVLVHVRAPRVDPSVAEGALEGTLPRLMELYRRLWQDVHPVAIAGSGSPTWIAWRTKEEWGREKRVPWAGADERMRRLLQLPGHVPVQPPHVEAQ